VPGRGPGSTLAVARTGLPVERVADLEGRAPAAPVLGVLAGPGRAGALPSSAATSDPSAPLGATTPPTRYAMIIKGPGYDPAVHRASLASSRFSTEVRCVSTVEDGFRAAADLAAGGVQLIELCGGFSRENAAELRARLGGRIPVGVVQYTPQEKEEQDALFGDGKVAQRPSRDPRP
jgi:hypothetical protein